MTPSDTSIAQHAQNADLFRRFIQVGFGQGDVAVVDELFAPGFVEHQAGVHPPTAEGVKGLIRYLHQALPDVSYTVEDLASAGATVRARLRAHGTHQGVFLGLPPTGQRVTIEIIDICRFVEGRITEHWGDADRLGAREQMGRGA
jgi:predicted ester cyclase